MRIHNSHIFLVFLIFFALYLTTLATEPQFGDNSEFLTAYWHLGICHNPGYPVQSLAGHGLMHLTPCGSIAFRGNLISAIWGAAALSILAAIGISLGFTRPVMLWSVLLAGAGPLIWSQSTSAEVYTADMCMVAVNLWIISRLRSDPRMINLLGLTLAAGVMVHLSQTLYLPGFVIVAVAISRPRIPILRWLPTVPFVLIGLSLWVYLPIRSACHPAINFGDPSTWEPFLDMVTGAAHRRFQVMSLPWQESLARIPAYFRECMFPSLHFVGSAAAITGWFMVLKNRWELAITGAWIILANLIYAALLNQVPYSATPFGLPSVWVCGIFAGAGMTVAEQWIQRRSPRIGPVVGVIILIGLAIQPVISHFAAMDRSRDWIPRNYGTVQQTCLPPEATLMVQGDDDLFIGLYLRSVERFRPDIRWIDATGSLGLGPLKPPDAYLSSAGFFMAFSRLEQQIGQASPGSMFYSWRRSGEFEPVGLAFSAAPANPYAVGLGDRLMSDFFPETPPDLTRDFQYRRAVGRIRFQQARRAAAIEDMDGFQRAMNNGLAWGAGISETYSEAGEIHLAHGQDTEAIAMLEHAIDLRPTNEAAYYLLGSAYRKRGDVQRATQADMMYQRLLRRHFAE